MQKDTNVIIKQHQKCIGILELIATNERYLTYEQGRYNKYIALPPHDAWYRHPMYDHYAAEKMIETKKAITARLRTYYANQVNKLINL